MRKLICTVLATLAVAVIWSATASPATVESYTYTAKKTFSGVKGSVALDADRTFMTGSIAFIRLERSFQAGQPGMIQAGPLLASNYLGACATGTFGAIGVWGDKIAVEWQSARGKYSCRTFDHPSGDVKDPVEIKLVRETGGHRVYVDGNNRGFYRGTPANGMAMTATGVAREGLGHPDYVRGYFNYGPTKFSATAAVGDSAWSILSGNLPQQTLPLNCGFPCEADGMIGYPRVGYPTGAFLHKWEEG